MRLTLFSLVTLVAATAFAELPPYVYEEMQEKAPELLQIEVLTSKKQPSVSDKARPDGSKVFRVQLTAKVLDVERSGSGLKKGDVIKIEYGRTERPKDSPWVGPSEIPLLKKGVVTEAYLGKGEESDVYSPAARGKSFQTFQEN